MNLHILHMTSGHEAFDTRIVAKQCAGLATLGYRVTLVARAPLDPDLPMPDGVQLVTVPRPKSRADRFMVTARRVIAAARAENPDIYHFHDPDLLPYAMVLAQRKARVVYDVHEDYRTSVMDRSWMPGLSKPLARQGIAYLEARMGALGWVAAATPDIAAFFDPQRTALIQNFPSLAEFDKGPAAAPYQSRANRLAYVGAITEDRGVSDIVEAFPIIAQTNPDIQFDLVGTASDGFLSKLRAMPGWKWTRYHGRLNRAEVINVLHHARAGIVTLRDLPRYRVAQPTKLYEYMAAGLPIISSDFPLWKDQVGAEVGIFVRPRPDDIATAAVYLLSNPQKAFEMGQLGRLKVEKDLSWEADLVHLEALYAKAMAS